MPFDPTIQDYVNRYIEGHLPAEDKINQMFSYIKEDQIRERIITEYKNTRYIYKFFEGMQVKDELLLAQIRLQIIMYSNVYEAILHHIIFELYSDSPFVIQLQFINAPKEIHIPRKKLEKLKNELSHDGKDIKTYYIDSKKRDITKIRFDEKAKAAFCIGLIDKDLQDEIIDFYSIRNAIHLHAEVRKDIDYELKMSKLAYWRIEKFNDLISTKLKHDGKIQ